MCLYYVSTAVGRELDGPLVYPEEHFFCSFINRIWWHYKLKKKKRKRAFWERIWRPQVKINFLSSQKNKSKWPWRLWVLLHREREREREVRIYVEWYHWRVNLCFSLSFSGMGTWFPWVITRVPRGVGLIEEDDLSLLCGRYWLEEMEEWGQQVLCFKIWDPLLGSQAP